MNRRCGFSEYPDMAIAAVGDTDVDHTGGGADPGMCGPGSAGERRLQCAYDTTERAGRFRGRG